MGLRRRRRISAGKGVAPIGVAGPRPSAGAAQRRLRDRRRQERNRPFPAEVFRQHQIGEPQRQNLGLDRRAVGKDRYSRTAGARGLASDSAHRPARQIWENAVARADSARTAFTVRGAIYTRKSSDEGLEQEFNSLDAQREACEAYIVSQRHAGWTAVPDMYDDGGLSGGTMERPALKRLLADIKAGKVQIVVVYKVDRLTRSLADFAKIVDVLDGH